MNRFFPSSKPRAVEGGLKARSQRGAISQTWWSERFIAVLEGIGMGNRLQRGRSYARKGQVISLEVDAGSATARVQGSRARPYRVRIGLQAFGKAQWAGVERELAGDAWYGHAARWRMTDDIEESSRRRPSLFRQRRELSLDALPTECVQNIARHVYLLAESSTHPFASWLARPAREDLRQPNRALGRHPPLTAENRGVPSRTVCELLRQGGGNFPGVAVTSYITKDSCHDRHHAAWKPARRADV